MRRVPRILAMLALTLGMTIGLGISGEMNGHNFVVSQSPQITELPDGKVYMTVRGEQVCTTADADHPLNRAAGTCDGGCVTDNSGVTTCMGSCTWIDRDGEMAFFTWDGQDEGRWALRGGTGKWAKATGEGTWEDEDCPAGRQRGIIRVGPHDRNCCRLLGVGARCQPGQPR